MRSIRQVGLGVALVLAGAAPGLRAQRSTPPATVPSAPPEAMQVARQYVGAMQDGKWGEMAALMHPAALAQFRTFLAAVVESDAPRAAQLRQALLGVNTQAEARAMSDTAMFAAFLGASAQQDPGLLLTLKQAKTEFLGAVPEGPDTLHIVYRMTIATNGVTVTRMDVFSMSHTALGWRGLLKGDMSAMAAELKRAVNQ